LFWTCSRTSSLCNLQPANALRRRAWGKSDNAAASTLPIPTTRDPYPRQKATPPGDLTIGMLLPTVIARTAPFRLAAHLPAMKKAAPAQWTACGHHTLVTPPSHLVPQPVRNIKSTQML
jgi:hypothetical protein